MSARSRGQAESQLKKSLWAGPTGRGGAASSCTTSDGGWMGLQAGHRGTTSVVSMCLDWAGFGPAPGNSHPPASGSRAPGGERHTSLPPGLQAPVSLLNLWSPVGPCSLPWYRQELDPSSNRQGQLWPRGHFLQPREASAQRGFCGKRVAVAGAQLASGLKSRAGCPRLGVRRGFQAHRQGSFWFLGWTAEHLKCG